MENPALPCQVEERPDRESFNNQMHYRPFGRCFNTEFAYRKSTSSTRTAPAMCGR